MKRFIILMLCLIGAMTLNTNHAFSRNRKVVYTIFADDWVSSYLGDSLYVICDSVIRKAVDCQDNCSISSTSIFSCYLLSFTIKKQLKEYTYVECYNKLSISNAAVFVPVLDYYCALYPFDEKCKTWGHENTEFTDLNPMKQIEYEIE